MKRIIVIFLSLLLSANSYCADISFVGDFIEVFKISRNGLFGGGGGCSNCTGFAEAKCPKFSEEMVKDHLKYGILGHFNDQKRFENCTKGLVKLSDNDRKTLYFQFDQEIDRTLLPSKRSYGKCLDSYSLQKGRSSDQLSLVEDMLEVYEIYNRLNIEHHKDVQLNKMKFLKRLPLSTDRDKKIEELRDYYSDIVSMDSCFTSEINCFGASWTRRSVPYYKDNQVRTDNSKLTPTAAAYLKAASCLTP